MMVDNQNTICFFTNVHMKTIRHFIYVGTAYPEGGA